MPDDPIHGWLDVGAREDGSNRQERRPRWRWDEAGRVEIGTIEEDERRQMPVG
jgi:hypothetical protein